MFEYIPEIGIVDTRNIINLIRDLYNYDFKEYALTSLMFRIEKFLYQYGIKHPDVLLLKLKDKEFFDQFLKDIAVDSTEMFRDPSFWRLLRDEIIVDEIKKNPNYHIWLPSCVSGDELFTLCIILKEINLLDKVTISATYLNTKILTDIQTGVFINKKIEISDQNYTRYNGLVSLSAYYSINSNGIAIRDTSLIKNVKFIKDNLIFENAPKKVNLIIFRNQLIYFNTSFEEKILEILSESIVENGYLVIGTKELLNSQKISKRYIQISELECIYKKKV